MPKLQVILTSVREHRQGAAVADWFVERARAHGGFDVELVDLKDVGLPLLEEPNHPMKRAYVHDYTKAWSARVASADAFVFVTPEYNYGMPPALLNALDHLYHEWCYKPAGFVSYGGLSGGLRSVQHAKSVVGTLKMMAIPEGVALPFFGRSVQEDGRFDPGEVPNASVTAMLDELLKWSNALKALRA